MQIIDCMYDAIQARISNSVLTSLFISGKTDSQESLNVGVGRK